MRRQGSDGLARARAPLASLLLPSLAACLGPARASTPASDAEADPVAPSPAPVEVAASPPPSAPAATPLAPIGDAEKARWAEVHLDPEPEAIIRDTHYFVSNEQNPERFRAALEAVGGVGLGVGAEQNYLFAGWARPELLLLVDFDQAIVDLHAVYRVAFMSAVTPDEFCALWAQPGRRRFAALLDRAYADSTRPHAARRIFTQARSAVEWRLGKIREHFQDSGVPTFLTDAQEYAYVRDLYVSDRVVRLRGDLTGRRTFSELGELLTAERRLVRWAYLSNAEQYFRYTPRFRKNVFGLPVDDKSLLLRTRARGRDYTYVVQHLDNFTTWLKAPNVRSVRAVVPRALVARGESYLEIATEPPPALERRQRKPRPEGEAAQGR